MLKAPGGGSSISFGDEALPASSSSRRRRAADRLPQISFGDEAPAPARAAQPEQATYGMRSDARANSSNAYANGADQNCGNFITDRTTSRVLKAPGGGSSISFGDEAPAGQLQQQAPTAADRPRVADLVRGEPTTYGSARPPALTVATPTPTEATRTAATSSSTAPRAACSRLRAVALRSASAARTSTPNTGHWTR